MKNKPFDNNVSEGEFEEQAWQHLDEMRRVDRADEFSKKEEIINAYEQEEG